MPAWICYQELPPDPVCRLYQRVAHGRRVVGLRYALRTVKSPVKRAQANPVYRSGNTVAPRACGFVEMMWLRD